MNRPRTFAVREITPCACPLNLFIEVHEAHASYKPNGIWLIRVDNSYNVRYLKEYKARTGQIYEPGQVENRWGVTLCQLCIVTSGVGGFDGAFVFLRLG